MEYKTCTRCKFLQPLENFYKRTDNRSKGTPQGQRSSLCAACYKIVRQERMAANPAAHEHRKEQQREYAHDHKTERYAYQKDWTQNTTKGWFKYKFHNAKQSAVGRSKNHRPKELDIDRDHLIELWKNQNGICALTGVRMTTKYNCPFSASADRIDSSKGYVPGNIQLVSKAAQLGKGNLTDKEFRRWLKAVRSIH